MRGLPGLVMMRSVTKYGISVVTLVFRDDVDIYFARQQVLERLAEVEPEAAGGRRDRDGPDRDGDGRDLPVHARERQAGTPAGLDVAELTRLRTIQDWVVTPLLKGVPGVTEINSFGGYLQQFQVLVDPDKLLKYDLLGRGGARGDPQQQLERRRQRRRARVRAVHHPRRRPDPVGGRHPARSCSRRRAARRSTIGDVGEVRIGHADPAGRRAEERPAARWWAAS